MTHFSCEPNASGFLRLWFGGGDGRVVADFDTGVVVVGVDAGEEGERAGVGGGGGGAVGAGGQAEGGQEKEDLVEGRLGVC